MATLYKLKNRPNRTDELLAHKTANIFSYTLDRDYVTEVVLDDDEDWKILPLGWVLAYNPDTNKVVPNYASYGFAPVGVLRNDAQVQFADTVVGVVWDGDVIEKFAIDQGVLGTVTEATKTALQDRLRFVRVTSVNKYQG